MRETQLHLLDSLGVPRDPRGIVLVCGFVVAVALGAGMLLANGDPLGIGYLGIAVVGYLFIQTRFLPAFLWLIVAALGVWGGVSGAVGGWIEAALAALLAGVAVLPVPLIYRDAAVPDQSRAPLSKSPAAVVAADFHQLGQPTSATGAQEPQPNLSQVSTAIEESPIANGEPSPEDVFASSYTKQVPSEPHLVLQAIGRLEIRSPDRDLGSELHDKSVLFFLFAYLLTCWVLGEPKIKRSALGDELSPNMPAQAQLERVRKQIYDLQRDLPPAVGSLIHANRSHVWLSLEGVDSDLETVRELALAVRKDQFTVPAETATTLRDVLNRGAGKEFLPGFEEVERKVTQGRGVAGQLVVQARLRIADQLADLARALAEYEDVAGHSDVAIPQLRAALEAMPGRQDLARLLAIAYLKSGQPARANEVRRQFALGQEQ